MECLHPVGTYRMDKSLAFRPCGQCVSCRINHSKQWAIRCVHEAHMHDQNCFITLTYNNDHLPSDRSVRKHEMQNFMKKLRSKNEGKKIRFFGCGEYGEQKSRPHYHLCLFGHEFDDLETWRHIEYGTKTMPLYTSKKLAGIWKKGFHTIGELNYETAAYVARYVMKKITGSSKEALELKAKKYGEKELEFALMSRMPGIGNSFYKKYKNCIYPKDFITHNGHRFKVPRYYDSLYAKDNPEKYRELKQKRIDENEMSVPHCLDAFSKDRSRNKINQTFIREDL